VQDKVPSSHAGARAVQLNRVKKFSFAFALVRPRRKMAAVFSEHDGYREFDLVSDAVVASIRESIYRQR
jgi:hypothetical protein